MSVSNHLRTSAGPSVFFSGYLTSYFSFPGKKISGLSFFMLFFTLKENIESGRLHRNQAGRWKSQKHEDSLSLLSVVQRGSGSMVNRPENAGLGRLADSRSEWWMILGCWLEESSSSTLAPQFCLDSTAVFAKLGTSLHSVLWPSPALTDELWTWCHRKTCTLQTGRQPSHWERCCFWFNICWACTGFIAALETPWDKTTSTV